MVVSEPVVERLTPMKSPASSSQDVTMMCKHDSSSTGIPEDNLDPPVSVELGDCSVQSDAHRCVSQDTCLTILSVFAAALLRRSVRVNLICTHIHPLFKYHPVYIFIQNHPLLIYLYYPVYLHIFVFIYRPVSPRSAIFLSILFIQIHAHTTPVK